MRRSRDIHSSVHIAHYFLLLRGLNYAQGMIIIITCRDTRQAGGQIAFMRKSMRAPHALPMLLMMPLTAAFQPIMACTSQMQTTRLARYVTVSARSSPPCARDAVVFLCPPVGWQHLNMGRALFEENAVFADAMRECDRIAEAEGMLPRRLLEVLYPAPHEEDECAALLQTPLFTIPALFAVEYSLSAMFEGCAPYAVIGHSVGEYVAAVVAGVFDLPVVMALVCERGRPMEASPLGGSMISLMADAATAELAAKEAAPQKGKEEAEAAAAAKQEELRLAQEAAAAAEAEEAAAQKVALAKAAQEAARCSDGCSSCCMCGSS